MLRCCRLGLAPCLLAAACGPEPAAPDAGLPVDARPGPVDLTEASWEIEPVWQSAATSSDPQLAFDPQGRPMVVWQEGVNSIGFAVREEGGWVGELVDPADAGEAFSPFIAPASEGGAHIVFSGDAGATGPDIFYMRTDGLFLAPPVNLTGSRQSAADFDASASVVEQPNGAIMVLYYTSPPEISGERRMVRLAFTDPASPGAPAEVLPATRNCGEIKPMRGEDGTVHVVTKCIPDAGFEVVYLNDRSGPLLSQLVDPGPARNMLSPDLGVGDKVHIAFRGTVDCGPDLCSDIYYSTNLAAARAVTGTPEENWENPTLILDGEGRVVLVFHGRDSLALHWTFLDEDGGFFRPQLVDPTGGGVTGSQPGFGAADPSTGLPWIAFERGPAEGAKDIWVGRMVP